MPTKAAVIQLTSSIEPENNFQTVQQLVAEAADQGAKLVVLPEMWATMVMGQEDKIPLAEAPSEGPIQDFMANLARQQGVWLVGGTIPMVSEDEDKVRAACLVYNDSGETVARYDKIHLFDANVVPGQECYEESAVTEPGDEVVMFETPVGRLGLAVCYDIRFPELFRVMSKHEVDIFAIPAAFTVTTGEAHWELLARARAVENFCYVLGACQWGEHDTGRKTFGGSCIIDPWGKVLEKMDSGTGVLTAELDLDYLHEVRTHMPVHEHRRISEI